MANIYKIICTILSESAEVYRRHDEDILPYFFLDTVYVVVGIRPSARSCYTVWQIMSQIRWYIYFWSNLR